MLSMQCSSSVSQNIDCPGKVCQDKISPENIYPGNICPGNILTTDFIPKV